MRAATRTALLLAAIWLIMGDKVMAAQPGSLDIVQGQSGQIEGKSVGVAWTAEDGTSAQIVVAGNAGGASWEVLCDVHPSEIVSLGPQLVEVTAITPSIGEKHGAVSFRPHAGGDAAPASDVVMLPAGGRLRLDGPSVMTATDFSAVFWQPDEQKPASVTAEWQPSRFPKTATPASDITRQDLRVGSTATVGHNRVTVAAIRGATQQNQATLVLRVAHQ
jgi:hypothetical protein